MSKRSLSHLEIARRQADAANLAALAGLLASELVNRSVHERDADKPDMAAVAVMLAERISALAGDLHEMMDHGRYLRERAAADGVLADIREAARTS